MDWKLKKHQTFGYLELRCTTLGDHCKKEIALSDERAFIIRDMNEVSSKVEVLDGLRREAIKRKDTSTMYCLHREILRLLDILKSLKDKHEKIERDYQSERKKNMMCITYYNNDRRPSYPEYSSSTFTPK